MIIKKNIHIQSKTESKTLSVFNKNSTLKDRKKIHPQIVHGFAPIPVQNQYVIQGMGGTPFGG